jgi:hypothetical protein
MLCAALSTLVAFAAIDRTATAISAMWSKPAPTWVAAPSGASPFGLLIDE